MAGDPALATAIRDYAAGHKAMMLANHGPVVAGSSLSAAADATEELEETAKLFLLLHGRDLRPLTPDQVAEIRAAYPADA